MAHLDAAIGRVVVELVATKQAENTLVVFTSDNGPQIVPADPTQNGGTSGELRGFKGTTYEGGIRVPGFVCWPHRLKPRKLSARITVGDWLPAFAALAGAATPAAQKLDGLDVWPLLKGAVTAPAKRVIYQKYLGGMAALREGDGKLTVCGTRRFARSLMVGDDREDQLFNIAADPLERENLAARRPEILARMQAPLIEQMKGDAPALRDGAPQYGWSRVPEQQRLMEQRREEVIHSRTAKKSASKKNP